ncbi:hypothetical protein [Marinivivus vitaminiproducens]|uniref:hypothetical protein n=1 Tax=Marinivivus vitaminiproducens TaxID=3035935 RepID=UPI0027A38A75|nr:hypothetical protein P4R82_24195 [Geminicoccaceae bacterium SCSIO 64248]
MSEHYGMVARFDHEAKQWVNTRAPDPVSAERYRSLEDMLDVILRRRIGFKRSDPEDLRAASIQVRLEVRVSQARARQKPLHVKANAIDRQATLRELARIDAELQAIRQAARPDVHEQGAIDVRETLQILSDVSTPRGDD